VSGARQPGRVREVFAGRDPDGDILVITVVVEFDGTTQGFQMYLDEPSFADATDELCKLFGAKHIQQIVGRECFALRCFDRWAERIEGLEVEGKRFTRTALARRHWPEKAKSRIEEERASLFLDIEYLTRRIVAMAERLSNIDSAYVDWENQP